MPNTNLKQTISLTKTNNYTCGSTLDIVTNDPVMIGTYAIIVICSD